ncbi:MAG: sensor histidine kinase [Pseudohongiellaceae bacterium]
MELPAIKSEYALNFSGVMVTILVAALGAYTVAGAARFPAVVFLAALQLTCFLLYLLLENRPRWLLLSLFATEAVCITGLFFLVPSSFIAVLSMVWLVQASDLFPTRSVLLLWGAILALFSIAQFYHYGTSDLLGMISSIVLYALLQLFAISVVQRFIREQRQREETAALNRELLATRELLSQSAAQGERLRIARDLHDILGHYMTALILNLEVASHKTDGESRDQVDQSLALAKLLLGELRTTVGELRDESHIDLEESVRKLVADIPLPIEVDFSRAPRIDDVEVAETLLRCTQEAITNVLRHSAASHCRVTMEDDAGRGFRLQVSDDGAGESDIVAGNGLTGMRERVAALGGELSWHRNNEGFHLQVALASEGRAT